MKRRSALPRLLALLVLLLPLGAAAAPAILVFGDSLSAGYGLAPEAGWVRLLENRLRQEGYPYKVVNASISGETTLGGRHRIEEALKIHRPAIVVVELGANDGLRGASIDSIRANLEAIVNRCREHRARVLLVGMRLPPNYGTGYAQKFQDVYADIARREGVPLVPFLFEGFALKREYFQADTVHPTRAAQPIILDTVWKGLKPMLRLAARADRNDGDGG